MSGFEQFIADKRAGEPLLESEAHYQAMAEAATDAIITINSESTILQVNPAAEKIFGYSIEEMLGQPLTMLMPEYLRHLHHAGITRYHGTGQKHIEWAAVQLPGLRKSGGEIPLEISFGEFVKGDQRFFTGIVRDVTERKRAEETQIRFARDASLRAEVCAAFNETKGSLGAILQTCAEAVVRNLDGALARIWTLNDDKDMLELQVIRRGLRGILETHDGWHVCREAATNGREAVELAVGLKPDVVVLDWSMPELNGLEAAKQIRAALPETEILIFTMHESEELIREALCAGVRAVVVKSDVKGHLITAVESILKHNVYFSPTASETLRNALIRSPEETGSNAPTVALTERELEVTRLLAEGKSNKEVATALSISTRTVETHRANIMRKLEINSIVELVHYAVRNKLVNPLACRLTSTDA